jgi:hypothetical protein
VAPKFAKTALGTAIGVLMSVGATKARVEVACLNCTFSNNVGGACPAVATIRLNAPDTTVVLSLDGSTFAGALGWRTGCLTQPPSCVPCVSPAFSHFTSCAGNKANNPNHLNSVVCGYGFQGAFQGSVSLGSAAAQLEAVAQPGPYPTKAKLPPTADFYFKTK